MIKKLKGLSVCLAGVLLLVALLPVSAFAAGPIVVDRPVKLMISYVDGGKPIPNARFHLYKVADVAENSTMTLTADFKKYQSTVAGLSNLNHLTNDEWLALAATLKGYAQADELTPAAQGYTGPDGDLSLTVTPGLYLIIGYRVTTADYYTYTAVPFMIYLPDADLKNNDWNYEVSAAPKFSKDYFPPDDDGDKFITRKVLKIWEDEGYETIRPESVKVSLLRDGTVFDSQMLNAQNNWRYAWDELNAVNEWTVVEEVPEGYAVKIEQMGITYKVTNKYVEPVIGVDPPVSKKITGGTPRRASTFTFLLKAADASCPMPEGSTGTEKTISITGAGTKEFGEIVFTKPGIYTYTISELNSAVKGYTYDKTVYTVTYTVTEQDGELVIARNISNGHSEVEKIEFANKFHTILPQTGVLWWPVPVLLFAGFAFITAGIVRRRRYKDR